MLASVLAGVVALAGCSSGEDPTESPGSSGPPTVSAGAGPLGEPGDPGTLCTLSRDGTLTYSLDEVSNAGPDPVDVTEVTMESATNVTLIGAWVVPVDGGGSAGAGTFPPRPRALAGVRWEDRFAAEEATLDPGPGQAALVVGLRLVDDTEQGSFDHLRVQYTSAGTAFEYRTSTRLIVPALGATCADSAS